MHVFLDLYHIAQSIIICEHPQWEFMNIHEISRWGCSDIFLNTREKKEEDKCKDDNDPEHKDLAYKIGEY